MKITEITYDSKIKSWGYHLILDCQSCNKKIVTDKDMLSKFVKLLVKEVGMVAHGSPLVDHFPQRDPGKTGLSLVQLIQTSSITCHCVDRTHDAYLDIFTCKEFDINRAIAFVERVLKPKHMRVDYLTRDAR